MTADPVLTLAWLALAHLVTDFVIQTNRVATEKFGFGRRAYQALGLHWLGSAICLLPLIPAFGLPGLAFAFVVSASHALIDRAKIVWTMRVEAAAVAEALARHEGPAPAASLGTAWTPMPAFLFVLDQLAHVLVTLAAWAIFLATAPVQDGFGEFVRALIGAGDPATAHRVVLTLVVLLDLAVINIRAGSLFVATLVHPREAVTGEEDTLPEAAPASEPLATDGVPELATAATDGAVRPSVAGPAAIAAPGVVTPAAPGSAMAVTTAAVADAAVTDAVVTTPGVVTSSMTPPALAAPSATQPPVMSVVNAAAHSAGTPSPSTSASTPALAQTATRVTANSDPFAPTANGSGQERPATVTSTARVGATIGVLERLLIVGLVLTNATAAVGFVLAAKTIARFKQLDDRQFAEYYLLGTLASVSVALGSALVAAAALAGS